MAGQLTLWGAGEMVLSFFSMTSSPPGSFWLALITETAPTLYVSGSEIYEPEADDYARVEIPNDFMNWTNASQPQIIGNAMDVSFTTAVSDWGVLRYWALCSDDREGFNYFIGDLEEPLEILTGDTAMVGAGDLSVSLGPFFLTEEE